MLCNKMFSGRLLLNFTFIFIYNTYIQSFRISPDILMVAMTVIMLCETKFPIKRKKLFYIMTHLKHFIYSYMALYIW